jgi:NADH:ubiquinone oxidoreductase subunit 4 (subunit M)
MGIIYTSAVTIIQIDLKKIIAYSSIGHMCYITIGIFSNNPIAIGGSILMMLGHGFISSGLFFCVGLLYDRYKTRLILNYGGLVRIMPIFSSFYFFFTLSNVGFPLTVNFIGEFAIIAGLFDQNTFIGILLVFGLFSSIIYSFLVYTQIIFGVLKPTTIHYFDDLNLIEFIVLLLLSYWILLLGLDCSFIWNVINEYIYKLFN